MGLPYRLAKIWNPGIYQGGGKRKKGYFEGWYNKIVSLSGDVMAFIPGISIEKKTTPFVQYIDGHSTDTGYFSYEPGEFTYSKTGYRVEIGGSEFSESGMSLDISSDSSRISGTLKYGEIRTLQSSFFSPGIMGWYTFVPLMECYHGVVSLHHSLEGSLDVDGRTIDFTGGYGYIEKDWGRSFPSSWIWVQTNHFETGNSSFMLSIARIPWLGSSFTGFFCVLSTEDREYRFATYTGAKIRSLEADAGEARIVVGDDRFTATVEIEAGDPGGLKAPVNGRMSRIIAESLLSTAKVTLAKADGSTLYSSSGIYAGLEMAGDIGELKADK